MAARIEDYAMIGDCRTAALVCRDGSIDWLCLPRFDSSSCFAALLGNRDNGRWLIGPTKKPKKIERRYRDCTTVLETTITTADGRVRVVDFMPSDTPNSSIVRMVTGLSGEVEMRTEIVIRFDHGLTIPWVSRVAPHTWSAIAGPHLLVLHAPVSLQGRDMRTVGAFAIREGQTASFVLAYGESHLAAPEAIDATVELERTERFWRGWSAACKVEEPSRAEIIRSLVTLKALTYRPTGGMVAAPTTSLPEFLGGERNWDYRCCWLRDATFTLLAFMNAGFMEEARNWRDWLMRVLAGAPSQVQPLYGLAGERRLDEWTVPWLEGYENSKPVRVGNAAALQLQLDIFGELADVLSQARRGGLSEVHRGNEIRKAFLQHLEKIWRDPDEGIWEIRGEPRHFTHSKVMAWCAFDRASGSPHVHEADKTHWAEIAREIHADVCRNGIDQDRNCFVQSYGSPLMDASLLMLAIVGFLPADDPRIRNTVAEIEKHLLVDGLLMRYETRTDIDGLPPGEGVFLACSFWLADMYVLLGRIEEAENLFRGLTSLANDVGLYAEEYDPRSRRMLGNFPQAFSHVALVNTALNLLQARQRAERGPVQRHTD